MAITVTNVNEAPAFSSGTTASFAENATGTVYTAAATDPEAAAVTYSLSGTDAALFSINATSGVVTFNASPNFELPGDVGNNNVYDFTVNASDGTLMSTRAVAITVTNVNEAPTVTSATTANVAENTTGTVYTAVATDPEAAALTYSITGTDAALFSINTSTGAVSFVTSPNFESPTDAGANNVYNFTVNASDGTNTTSSGVAITVTNVNEAPVNAIPGSQNMPANGMMVFSSSNSNAISISDVDAGSGILQVTLSASNGSISLGALTGLSFSAGDGVSDVSMTFTGTGANINSALNGSSFKHNASTSGAASLSITTSDQGNTGAGGALTDTDTINIAVSTGITSVSSTSPSGNYRLGDTLNLSVSFSDPVTVNTAGGIPTLRLETGSTDRSARYVSGSGSSTLTFSYTVQAGDTSLDLDYISASALTLNGASIRNASNVDVFLTLPAVGGINSIAGQNAIVIDGALPTASIVVADNSLSAGETSLVTIRFSEAVTGLTNADLTIENGSLSAVTSSDGGITWTAILNPSAGISDTSNLITLNNAGVQDAAGNSGTGTTVSNNYEIDTLSPSITSVSLPPGGNYTTGSVLTFTVNTSEPVMVDTTGGVPRLALNVSGTTVFATYVSGSGSTALVFSFTVQADQTNSDGIRLADSSLQSNGAVIRDASGNTLGTPLNGVGNLAAVRINPVNTISGNRAGTDTLSDLAARPDLNPTRLILQEPLTPLKGEKTGIIGSALDAWMLDEESSLSLLVSQAQIAELRPSYISNDGSSALSASRVDLGAVSNSSGSAVNFSLPIDTFLTNNPFANITVQARQADGRVLPSWLRFDPSTGRLIGTPPAGTPPQTLTLVFVARDDAGNQVQTRLNVNIGVRAAANSISEPLVRSAWYQQLHDNQTVGRASLNMQFAQAGHSGLDHHSATLWEQLAANPAPTASSIHAGG